jgi:hypothetical protein
MAFEQQNQGSEAIETALTLEQAEEMAEPKLMRVFESGSIHQLLDHLLGDFEEDDSLVCF